VSWKILSEKPCKPFPNDHLCSEMSWDKQCVVVNPLDAITPGVELRSSREIEHSTVTTQVVIVKGAGFLFGN